MRHRTPILIAAALIVGISSAVAQQSVDGPYVLHEYFAEIDESGAEAGATPAAQPEQPPPGPGMPPALSLEARPGEPIYAEDGPVFEKEIEEPHGALSPFGGANTLDDRTDRVDSLTYYSNFDPSVIPYKRVVAQNRVVLLPNGDYVAKLRAGEQRPVELASQAGAATDVFWGTFLLRLEPNQLQPLASVAPDQQILRIETEPDVAVTIFRDRGDNYYVRSRVGGLIRLNLQIAAPRYYFNGEFTPVQWDDFPTGVVPPMAPDLRASTQELARSVGFDRRQSPEKLIVEMIRYFRNFDARPLPENLEDEDRLTALVENQIGVCRHRSLAFVAIAQALGIPTRYVYNEAHAFVEVFWPSNGWRRVDLGGAADELNASATEGRTVHDSGPDQLPTPDRYVEEQERMARNGWNAPGLEDNRPGPDGGSDGSDGTDGAEEPANDAANAQPVPGTNGDGQVAAGTNGAEVDRGEPAEAASLPPPAFTEPPPDDRTETRLTIDQATAVVRRGGQLTVEARLTRADGGPLRDREVSIYLGPVGMTDPGAAVRLGSTRTGDGGRLSARVAIPREQTIGRWSLFLVFSGDEELRPAVAE